MAQCRRSLPPSLPRRNCKILKNQAVARNDAADFFYDSPFFQGKSVEMKILLVAVLSMSGIGAALAADTNEFERVLPVQYSHMLRDAKFAYDEKRYDDAFRLFQRTACAGDKESQSALGRMYLLGQGVVRDDITGYAWLKVAAEMIFPGYQKIVHQLEEAMTSEQRALADARARQMIDLYGRAATNMSCSQNASRGGYVIDSIVCTPRREGNTMLLKQCANTPLP